MKFAKYNPNDLTDNELPTIFGFSNGGSVGFMDGVLMAEDGTFLGSHLCSNEHFMYGDLGVLEGTRPDRHETFRKHYPNGYKMEFVRHDEIFTNEGLLEAISKHNNED